MQRESHSIKQQLNDITDYLPILPIYSSPNELYFADRLPCHHSSIEKISTQNLLNKLNRKIWQEGLFIHKNDQEKILRYEQRNNYRNDFTEKDFFNWIQLVEQNTFICEMENEKIGKGVFVLPGKKIPKGTFIASTGIIKLSPSNEELETSRTLFSTARFKHQGKKIYGLINPEKIGGILDLINHAPHADELINFEFKENIIKIVSTSNLKSIIKFYNGYAIMGVEAMHDIEGGKYGKQLLWNYARSCEYIVSGEDNLGKHKLFLFDDRKDHQGEIIDSYFYDLKVITVFVDTGEPVMRKIVTLPRWELMENAPDMPLIISTEDPFSSDKSRPIQSPVTNGLIQAYLRKNPLADRVILSLEL